MEKEAKSGPQERRWEARVHREEQDGSAVALPGEVLALNWCPEIHQEPVGEMERGWRVVADWVN